ncbi:rhomboid family intramembrane serine protease [Coleofasciculus sp. G2-EDA-02]|uniref:rhomboid family intramembrane serine protease n=1 Tax=Coleofasciculus sp. G2-EDA-02 TaxID=3069529 RepID=UPI0032F7B5A7
MITLAHPTQNLLRTTQNRDRVLDRVIVEKVDFAYSSPPDRKSPEMDINQLLLWIVCTSCILNIIVGMRRARISDSAPYIHSWMIVSGLVLATTAILYVITPENAGWIGGGLWGLLILMPILGFRLMNQLAYQERFGAASRLGKLLCWLHPAQNWRQFSELLDTLEQLKQGSTTEATAIINRYKTTNRPLVRHTIATLYKMEARWQELREWIETNVSQSALQHDSSLILYYLRALAEMGDINGLLAQIERFEPILERSDRGINQSQAYLFAFAFCGQKAQVAQLLTGPLAFYPNYIRRFWLATTDWAAGEVEGARQQLLAISNRHTGLYRHAIQARLSQSPVNPDAVLTQHSRQILAQLTLNLQHQIRYGSRERFLGSRAYTTWGIIGLNLIVFGFEIHLGGSENQQVLYALGALVPQEVLDGAWWRLLTSTFLHFGFPHLLMNMLGLYILGPFVEYALSGWRYLLLYLISGIGSMFVVSLATHFGYSEAQFVVGASGSVMGIVGATAAILLQGWRREKSRLASRRLRFILFIIAFQVVFDLSIPHVSFTGHTSGLIIGFLVGLLLYHK